MGSQEILVISSYRDGTHVVVTLVGELDMNGAAPLGAKVQQALSGPSIDVLEIEMGGLHFVDSAGIQAVLAAEETARLAGVTFRVAHVTPVVRRVIQLAGVEHLLLPRAEDADSS